MYVEKTMDLDPVDMVDEEYNRKVLKGAQFWPRRSKVLSDATKCYIKHCYEGGKDKAKKCATKSEVRDELMNCIKDEVRGIGPKTRDLMREYLGDPDAVAVDRHIMNYVCNVAGLCFPGKKKGKPITMKQYEKIKETVQDIAKKFDVTPAELQVSLWLKEACQSQMKKGKSDKLWLGKDKTVDCCDYQTCRLK